METFFIFLKALFFVIFVLWLFVKFLDYNYLRSFNKKSKEELEEIVFYFHDEYFDFIGIDNEHVQRFRSFITNRDLKNIRSSWNELYHIFTDLESKAGHQGRPLIMDYYDNYKSFIDLLIKKSK
ncbi:hypothetical protein [Candidatus Uabimicrobium sp. HlEnr_7]|uniref:hypothetical protein n=1 Tax=Candidatus Uabimicrobium helgolandensis TaxID=3095367 RepID=UPI0035574DE2